jgi:23S rRNA (uracil1939-C5)-methyltransferase
VGRSRRKLSDQPFDLDVVSLNARGLGEAAFEGRALQVLDALEGEKVIARNLFGRSQRGKAQTLEVLRASPHRVAPRCPHFGSCGACSQQHMSMQAQLSWKQGMLLQTLTDEGQVRPASVYEPLCGPLWNYRRKARLSVRDVHAKDRVLVGFRERNGRYVADLHTCHILRSEIASALPQIAALIRSLECRATVPQIEISCGDNASAMIVRHLEPLSESDIDRFREFSQEQGLAIFLQPGGPDSVRLLAPQDLQLEYRLDDPALTFRFEPLDFIQVNGGLNRLMVSRALQLLDPQPEDSVLDLFCGLGNFTLPLATRAGTVTGVEGSEQMVERGRRNAELNALANVEFHAADLYQPGGQPPWPVRQYDMILLDPPRSGALELLPWIAAGTARRVLYISCNPDTLARDAGQLVRRHGFELAGAGILDMFPHTPHSEAIALFERTVDNQTP